MIRIDKTSQQAAIVLGAVSLLFTAGCSTKNYVRSQTPPLVQKTNELDDATAANNRAIQSTNDRAQAGIQQAQASANTATQNATAATSAANQAQGSAQEAVNRADSLASGVANLDKPELTKADKAQLDGLATQLNTAKGYILEVTGGTDSVGSADYNYQLSQRRAQAVVQYIASKYNVPPHKFYLIGIGKDVEVATNKTAAGRAQNRRVEVQVLSNAAQPGGPAVSAVR